MHRSPRSARLVLRALIVPSALLFIALLAAGCGDGSFKYAVSVDTTHPQHPAGAVSTQAAGGETAATGGLLVDLTQGSRATYAHLFAFQVFPDDGSVGLSGTIHAVYERKVDGTESVEGVDYTRVVETYAEDNGSTGSTVDLLRQDRSGLFLWQEDLAGGGAVVANSGRSDIAERFDLALQSASLTDEARDAYRRAFADILRRRALVVRDDSGEMTTLARGAKPGGPLASEITFLRYPLRPGATWDGRVGFNVWTVEAHDALVLPGGRFAAWRMRIELPNDFGPNDRYQIWYSNPGEVKHVGHFEGAAVDGQGQFIGTIVSDESHDLTGWFPE